MAVCLLPDLQRLYNDQVWGMNTGQKWCHESAGLMLASLLFLSCRLWCFAWTGNFKLPKKRKKRKKRRLASFFEAADCFMFKKKDKKINKKVIVWMKLIVCIRAFVYAWTVLLLLRLCYGWLDVFNSLYIAMFYAHLSIFSECRDNCQVFVLFYCCCFTVSTNICHLQLSLRRALLACAWQERVKVDISMTHSLSENSK